MHFKKQIQYNLIVKNTLYPSKVSMHLRFDVQCLKVTKNPYKVSDVNKKANPLILAVTLDGDQVTYMAREIFQPKSKKCHGGEV
jgi:hypothetical protein